MSSSKGSRCFDERRWRHLIFLRHDIRAKKNMPAYYTKYHHRLSHEDRMMKGKIRLTIPLPLTNIHPDTTCMGMRINTPKVWYESYESLNAAASRVTPIGSNPSPKYYQCPYNSTFDCNISNGELGPKKAPTAFIVDVLGTSIVVKMDASSQFMVGETMDEVTLDWSRSHGEARLVEKGYVSLDDMIVEVY
jgi:hypothetical protein